MIIKKTLSLKSILSFTWFHIVWLTLWCSAVVILFKYTHWKWLALPWLPLSIIGTALAFYVGFKNNQAYDRMWEARKIWGGIVNTSRSWGTAVKNFTSNSHSNGDFTQEEVNSRIQKLVYYHIAWLYGLRYQLLQSTPWEHINQRYKRKYIERRMQRFGVGQYADSVTRKEFEQLLPSDIIDQIRSHKNPATQIIDRQSQHLAKLYDEGLIDDFRHMELQKLLTEMYTLQGKCERIKKFPLPREYSNASKIFVAIFIFLLPFGMLGAFASLDDVLKLAHPEWLAIPFSVIIGWIYLFMELIGDYSENPFEGLENDIPMLSLCRTIEIDLREMLGETDLPEPIKPIDDTILL